MLAVLEHIFSHICGQYHRWSLGEITLPMCQRCTGLYVGTAICLVLHVAFRPRPSRSWLVGHVMAFAATVPFTAHLVRHGEVARLFCGQLFGCFLICCLTLLPRAHMTWFSTERPHGKVAYTMCLLASFGLVLVCIGWGGSVGGVVLCGLACAGALVLMGLFVTNLLILILGRLVLRSNPEYRLSSVMGKR